MLPRLAIERARCGAADCEPTPVPQVASAMDQFAIALPADFTGVAIQREPGVPFPTACGVIFGCFMGFCEDGRYRRGANISLDKV